MQIKRRIPITIFSNLSLTLVTLVLLVCGGCQSKSPATGDAPGTQSNSDIEAVRNGVLAGYNSTTVGKAFEGTFQNPKWTSFETPKGATVVEFDGIIPYKTIAKVGFRPYKTVGQTDFRDVFLTTCQNKSSNADEIETCLESTLVPVKFQFSISTDKQNFTLAYIDPTPFSHEDLPSSGDRLDRNRVLAFIYQ